MPVLLTNRQRRFPVDAARLVRQARACLEHLGLQGATLSVLLVNDPAMRALNRTYRGVGRTTDVLAFPLHEGGPEAVRAALAQGEPELGDVVISVQRARAQAKRAGVAPAAELTLLLVHGILHLTGLDHEAGPAEAARMRAAEAEALAHLGLDADGLIGRAAGAVS
jgi:probable rRNA maturation factor